MEVGALSWRLTWGAGKRRTRGPCRAVLFEGVPGHVLGRNGHGERDMETAVEAVGACFA